MWCLDSGCSAHMCSNASLFESVAEVEKTLHLANNETTKVNGVGDVKIEIKEKRKNNDVTLKNVLLVSDLRQNLISVSKITDKGHEVHFRKNEAVIVKNNGEEWLRAKRYGNLYYINIEQYQTNKIDSENYSDIDLWHYRMGHLNEHDLKNMSIKDKVHGMNIKENDKLSKCEICITEKQVANSYKSANEKRTNHLLEIVHSDVCGPMRTESLSGRKYFVTFIDDYSRYCEVYFLSQKSEVFEAFQNYKAAVENFTGHKIN